MSNQLKRIALNYRYLVVITIATTLRLLLIDSSFWLDEAAQALESTRPLVEQFDISADFQPPLYHLLVHFVSLASQAEWWLRMSSFIPGIISIYLTMKLAERWLRPSQSLIVGLLLATSQFHLFYSQELRPYALAAMFSLLSLSAWLALTESTKKFSIWFIVSTTLSWLTMYVTPVVSLSLLVATKIIYPSRFYVIFKNLILAFVLWLPIIPLFIDQFATGKFLQNSLPGWESVVSAPQYKAVIISILKLIIGRIQFNLDLTTLIIALLFLLPVIILVSQSFKEKKLPRIPLIIIITTLTTSFLVSFYVPILDPKRVLVILPLMYIILASGVSHNKLSQVAVVVLLIGNCVAIGLYLTKPINQREPWREAISYIESVAQPESKVVFAFTAPFAPWEWYQTRNLTAVSFTKIPINSTEVEKLLSQDQTSDYVVFEYLMDLTDANRMTLQGLTSLGYVVRNNVAYPNLGQIWFFTREDAFAYSKSTATLSK